MTHLSLHSCGIDLVTGLLHGLNEGYLSLAPVIVNPTPPCRETESMVEGIVL